MTVLYVETSAILTWFFEQKPFEKIMLRINQAEKIATSILSLLEAKRAFTRLAQGHLPNYRPLKLLGALAKESASWNVMEINQTVQARVSEKFPVEPVRTLDAIHLATALEFSYSFPDLQVLTLDQRIASNLEPLGLTHVKI